MTAGDPVITAVLKAKLPDRTNRVPYPVMVLFKLVAALEYTSIAPDDELEKMVEFTVTVFSAKVTLPDTRRGFAKVKALVAVARFAIEPNSKLAACVSN